jgi:hypothetical protein
MRGDHAGELTRESTPSLVNACRRWLLTVCGETNNRTAVSRFVSPRSDEANHRQLGVGERGPPGVRTRAGHQPAADTVGVVDHASQRPLPGHLRQQTEDAGGAGAGVRVRVRVRSSIAAGRRNSPLSRRPAL